MNSAMRRWQALDRGDRIRLPLLMLGLPLISLLLRLVGYQRTRRLIDQLSRHPAPSSASEEELRDAQGLARLAGIAGRRRLVEATCLRQALLVYGLLRRRGLQPELKIGVRREGTGIGAHAWVELDHHALGQTESGYRTFTNEDVVSRP